MAKWWGAPDIWCLCRSGCWVGCANLKTRSMLLENLHTGELFGFFLSWVLLLHVFVKSFDCISITELGFLCLPTIQCTERQSQTGQRGPGKFSQGTHWTNWKLCKSTIRRFVLHYIRQLYLLFQTLEQHITFCFFFWWIILSDFFNDWNWSGDGLQCSCSRSSGQCGRSTLDVYPKFHFFLQKSCYLVTDHWCVDCRKMLPNKYSSWWRLKISKRYAAMLEFKCFLDHDYVAWSMELKLNQVR